VKKNDTRILRQRKGRLARRLERRRQSARRRPMFSARNVQYEMAERTQAIDCGAIGAFHVLATNSGLVEEIDKVLELLKVHLPYHESDHVLNIAYNILTGGTSLDDIELHRNNETYMDALGAQRIPDPTTAGDFARRFCEEDVVGLMDAVNVVRVKIWRKRLTSDERLVGIVDVDGVVAPTTGECKQGMDIAYNGLWGYHPLLVSLANTQEPVFLVNRSGNRPSHEGAADWIDRAVDVVSGPFRRVWLRGDTDFALTGNFDRWSAEGVGFVFGIDAMANLVGIAQGIEERRWHPLDRGPKRALPFVPRERPENVKERIVVERGFRNITLETEDIAEFPYQPTKCERSYRIIVVRKTLSVKEGQKLLLPEVRYFFYITNLSELTATEVVFFANDRGNQENLIEQLKNGVHALRMPVDDLVSNWAYMVMASLAWTLKAWFALMVRQTVRGTALLRMEFRRFLGAIVRIPCQVIRTGRRIVFRILGYNDWVSTLLQTFERIRKLELT